MLYTVQKRFRFAGGRRGARLAIVSYEERKTAVGHCIAHKKNYKLTAAHSRFTYGVQRYQKAGQEGLSSGHHSTQLAAENLVPTCKQPGI